MLDLTDFEVGKKAYIVMMHWGRNEAPEIIETKVKSVGRKYVAVEYKGKKFHRVGTMTGLFECADCGESGELFSSRILAEREIEKEELIAEMRWSFNLLSELSNEELKVIQSLLKRKMDGNMSLWFQKELKSGEFEEIKKFTKDISCRVHDELTEEFSEAVTVTAEVILTKRGEKK